MTFLFFVVAAGDAFLVDNENNIPTFAGRASHVIDSPSFEVLRAVFVIKVSFEFLLRVGVIAHRRIQHGSMPLAIVADSKDCGKLEFVESFAVFVVARAVAKNLDLNRLHCLLPFVPHEYVIVQLVWFVQPCITYAKEPLATIPKHKPCQENLIGREETAQRPKEKQKTYQTCLGHGIVFAGLGHPLTFDGSTLTSHALRSSKPTILNSSPFLTSLWVPLQ